MKYTHCVNGASRRPRVFPHKNKRIPKCVRAMMAADAVLDDVDGALPPQMHVASAFGISVGSLQRALRREKANRAAMAALEMQAAA